MNVIWEYIIKLIQRIGLPGLGLGMFLEGLGIPFPGETVLALFGFLTYRGEYSIPLILLTATTGAWVGSFLAFYLGKAYGIDILYKYGKYIFLKEKYISKTRRLSEKYGVFFLILGRHLPGVRTVSSYFAGMGGMQWKSFFVFSFIGFGTWTATWALVGFVVADRWQAVVQAISSWTGMVTIAIVLMGGLIFYIRKRMRTVPKKGAN